ncbi:MAG: PKD domain-containing protein, partial [Thermoplasmata archaeon]|nr:PKD domain-containing protein [Thermoplasmata archaeon]
ASVVDATTPISITSATFWNAISHTYSGAFDAVATASSTGSCAVGPLNCVGFSGGFYPFWSLHALSGTPVWEYGGSYPSQVRAFGGPTAPSADVLPRYDITTTLSSITTGADAGGLYYLRGEATDPSGISQVNVETFSCEDLSGVASVVGMGVLGSSFGTPYDGIFNVSFASTFAGHYPIWVTAYSVSGHATARVYGSVNVSGGSACSFPAPTVPTIGPADVTPIAAGYQIRWNDSDPAIAGFVLNATSPSGASIYQTVGPVGSSTWQFGAPGVAYNLSISAFDAGGGVSLPSAPLLAPPTAGALVLATPWLPPSAMWLGSAALNISGTVSGGVAPFQVLLYPGDGSPVANATSSGNFTLVHDYASYWGEADVVLVATDAVGDVARLGPFVFPIYATPLGVLQTAMAGDGLVNISYGVPASPVAGMTGYAIVVTTDPALAWELGRGTRSNATVPGISVWNTTRTYLLLSATDGTTVYAQVLARNSYGVGWLPTGNAILTTTPAVLALTPIVTVPGGSAPFTDTLSASAAGGTGIVLIDAFYSYPPGVVLTPTIQDVNGTFWLNATTTFPSPGNFVVVLHVVDIFFDVAIETTPVFVAPGAPPALSAQLINAPAYAGAPLSFQATATGGSGQFNWNWSFGDGNSSSLANPYHVYQVSGDYTVVLKAVDAVTGGANTTTLSIVVYALPVLFVSVTPGPNGSYSYDFQAEVGGGSGPSIIVWTFGDGVVAHGLSVSHDYRESGTYSVNVTATDPAGRAGTTEFNLSAFASSSGGAPAPGFTELDVTLLVVAAGFGILAVLLGVRRGRLESPPPRNGDEDGEVSLT